MSDIVIRSPKKYGPIEQYTTRAVFTNYQKLKETK
jgi:hypothetical protein